MPLCPDFLSVFEGEPHIVLSVDGHEIHQSAPEGDIKGVHQFSLCQGFEESLNLCPAGLLAMDGIFDCLKPSFGSVKPCCQTIITFLVLVIRFALVTILKFLHKIIFCCIHCRTFIALRHKCWLALRLFNVGCEKFLKA